ncbi:FxLD family lanthipeptide [Streptomyces sp. NBC_01803]|uniref:FxLD family lanthipeptide n=1 Tax=Streptomyces sp. NBC_01803 TaxID=2975946 RepID=UPI002DDB38B8|nr:FxLD family lanthipeptide [Streptomyces sp. NBC_01803]WSA44201.1 FxLD family lanthipeptide [Streptomyces sp. NBC_01803]
MTGKTAETTVVLDEEFTLDVRVVEAALPVAGLLLSTSDNCGQTCEKDACLSTVEDPSVAP